jgi:uncharacterized membrane protein YdfJ with MMPL/SSD domain
MHRLSNFVLRHRLAVGLFWLAVLVVGMGSAGKVSGRLSTDFSLPGAKSYDADRAILRAHGSGGPANPLVLVVTLPAGNTVDNRTGSTTTAITEGLGRTGRLVTSAALILFLAFTSLASIPQTDVKIMATGLGAGILLDATLVRALLVPALVSLFGRWNWWLPGWAARPLRVAPSPALPEREGREPEPSAEPATLR